MPRTKSKVSVIERDRVEDESTAFVDDLKKAESLYIKPDMDDVVYSDDKRARDMAEDVVSLYIAECSKTALLSGAEERSLSSRMELANYLAGLVKPMLAKHIVRSVELEIVKLLANRLGAHAGLLEKLFKHYHIAAGQKLSAKLADGVLKAHMNDVIDEVLLQLAAKNERP